MSLRKGIANALAWPRFLPFITYIFLLATVTAGAAVCFTLAETKTMELNDGTVVFLGNMTLVGGVIGFILGGMIIDRWGSRIVFITAHLSAAVLLSAFIFAAKRHCR